MSRAFRNVEGDPETDPAAWPYEAIVSTIERGTLRDWLPLIAAIERAPWGAVARQVEDYLAYATPYGVGPLLARTVTRARARAERSERDEVARRVRAALARTGATQARFADEVGTSRSRLSTYCSGTVVPSAAMLVRIERAGKRLAASR